jgi:D-amino-acid oxidase
MDSGATNRTALVLGSGVIGLTCAVVLAESGFHVTIWAREFPPHTTSDISAAVWYPYKCDPIELVREWGSHTLGELQRLSTRTDETGVRNVPGFKYFHRPMGPPWWAGLVPEFRLLGQAQVPATCRSGYFFKLPVADMSRYLPYLEKRFTEAGGHRERRHVQSLEEARGRASLVVNCTGLGARELVADKELYAIRGQILRVPKLSRDEIVMDDDHADGMIYVIPRLEDTILGGVAEEAVECLEPDDTTTAAIRRRCAHYFPELADSTRQIVKVGLRPGRASVRTQTERLPDGQTIVHCYGHGGSGLSLSWGSAQAVARLCEQAIEKDKA